MPKNYDKMLKQQTFFLLLFQTLIISCYSEAIYKESHFRDYVAQNRVLLIENSKSVHSTAQKTIKHRSVRAVDDHDPIINKVICKLFVYD